MNEFKGKVAIVTGAASGIGRGVVNTASVAGLISGPGIGIYKVTKHGVVSLSETLCCELAERRAKIKVSVLCPSWVNTESWTRSEIDHWTRRQAVQTGMSPAQVAEHSFNSIRKEQFYILTHPERKPAIQKRMEDILQERNPA